MESYFRNHRFYALNYVDYSGGIIITDWYTDSDNAKEAIKITLRFLSNEIQINSIKVYCS